MSGACSAFTDPNSNKINPFSLANFDYLLSASFKIFFTFHVFDRERSVLFKRY